MSDTRPADVPETMAPLAPYLVVAGAAAALDWYRDVLGAIETTRFVGDDGRVGHAEVVIGSSRLMLADEYPEADLLGPVARGGTTVTLHLEVIDVDHTHGLAVAGGATSLREPADQGHGNRNATVVDPFGHRWMLSQAIDAGRTTEALADAGPGGDGNRWTVTARPPVEPGYYVIHTPDVDRAATFFGALFDWDIEQGNQSDGRHVANTRFPMGLSGGGAPRAEDDGGATATPAGEHMYFRVDDLDLYAARVEELGGQVLERGAYDSGGNVACADDQGHRFDLWKPAPGY